MTSGFCMHIDSMYGPTGISILLINIATPCVSSYSTHQEVIELAISFAHIINTEIIILVYNQNLLMDSIYMFTLPQLTECGDRKETLALNWLHFVRKCTLCCCSALPPLAMDNLWELTQIVFWQKNWLYSTCCKSSTCS